MTNYIIVNGELKHYGVKGMKWGVRRYQNEDGSLTPRGKLRFKQVEGNERLARRQTKQATKLIRQEKNNVDVMAYEFENASNRAARKNHKMVAKGFKKLRNHDEAGAKKYIAKSKKYLNKSLENQTKRAKMEEYSSVLQKKIDDISSGQLKAGKDFIVNSQLTILPTPVGVFMGVKKNIDRKEII